MRKITIWAIGLLTAGLIIGFVCGVTAHYLIQKEVCQEVAGLMVTKEHFTLLSGCRWDMPAVVDTGELPEAPTTRKEINHE